MILAYVDYNSSFVFQQLHGASQLVTANHVQELHQDCNPHIQIDLSDYHFPKYLLVSKSLLIYSSFVYNIRDVT